MTDTCPPARLAHGIHASKQYGRGVAGDTVKSRKVVSYAVLMRPRP